MTPYRYFLKIYHIFVSIYSKSIKLTEKVSSEIKRNKTIEFSSEENSLVWRLQCVA